MTAGTKQIEMGVPTGYKALRPTFNGVSGANALSRSTEDPPVATDSAVVCQDNKRCIRKKSPIDDCQHTGLANSLRFIILVGLRHP